jgi:hypothetical protein
MAKRWWVALVTFERGDGEQDILEPHQQGASGWMACVGRHEADVRQMLANSLMADGLKLVEIERETPVDTAEEVAEFDEHLAENFVARDPLRPTVWGTIHCYLADGEA